MFFKETPNREMPTILLLHGGGFSAWSLKSVVEQLQSDFHLVTPIIDGHGEDGKNDFVSIEDSAKKLIAYLDANHHGSVFALGGLSIGAQIITEVLSQRPDIAKYAILESALVYPIRGTAAMTVPTFKLFYGLIQKRGFAKLQAKTLCLPDGQFEQYYQDSLKISKQSLINITLSNGSYPLKESIRGTHAKVLVIVGEKEIGIMKKSAQRLHEAIQGSELFFASGMKHGELSLQHPEEYAGLLKSFFARNP